MRRTVVLAGSGLDRLRHLAGGNASGLGMNETQARLDMMAQAAFAAIHVAGRLVLLDRSAKGAPMSACRTAGTGLVLAGAFNPGNLARSLVPGATCDYGSVPQKALDGVAVLAAEGRALAEAAPCFAAGHPVASVP